jgi:hypothetical protein
MDGKHAFFGTLQQGGGTADVFGYKLTSNHGVITVTNGAQLYFGDPDFTGSFVNSGELNIVGTGNEYDFTPHTGTSFIGIKNWGNLSPEGVIQGGTYRMTNGGVLLYQNSVTQITRLGAGTDLTVDSSNAIRKSASSVIPLQSLNKIDPGAALTVVEGPTGNALYVQAVFDNSGSLTLDHGTLMAAMGAGTGVFNNHPTGTVVAKNGGYLYAALGFRNDGDMSVNLGTLYGPGLENGGTITLANSSRGDFRNGLFINTGTINVDGSSILYYDSDGSTYGTVNVTVGGQVVSYSGLTGNQSTWMAGGTNSGDIWLAGGDTQLDSDLINVGTMTLQSGQTVHFTGAGQLTNNGTMSIDGHLFADLNVGAGGMLQGNGTITGNINQTAGMVKPGHSPGIMTVDGNYFQAEAGTLRLDFDTMQEGYHGRHDAGWNYCWSYVDASGDVTLNGALLLNFLSEFEPGTYEIMHFGGDLSFGPTFVLDAEGSQYNIQVIPDGQYLDMVVSEVPEPATCGLLLLGALALARRRTAIVGRS